MLATALPLVAFLAHQVLGGKALAVTSASASLNRADLVFGRRRRSRLAKWWLALRLLPRRLLLGLDIRDPDCLFWAARREALQEVMLTRGMHRFLAAQVSQHGFRVSETHVDHRRAPWPRGQSRCPGAINLLTLWWRQRNRDRNGAMPSDKKSNASSATMPTASPRSRSAQRRIDAPHRPGLSAIEREPSDDWNQADRNQSDFS